MASQRLVLLVDDEVPESAIAGEVGGRELWAKSRLGAFSGEQSTDVVYICVNAEAFMNETVFFDNVLERVMRVNGNFTLKYPGGTTEEVATNMAKALRLSGFVNVQIQSSTVITASKDSVEVINGFSIGSNYFCTISTIQNTGCDMVLS
jgi:hypothetical protein